MATFESDSEDSSESGVVTFRNPDSQSSSYTESLDTTIEFEDSLELELDQDVTENENQSDNYSDEDEVERNDIDNLLGSVHDSSMDSDDQQDENNRDANAANDNGNDGNNWDIDNGNQDQNLDLCIDLDGLKNDDAGPLDPAMKRKITCNPEWTEDTLPFHVDQFSRQTGPNLPQDFDVTTANANDYFSLYFTDQIFQMIADNTNRYVPNYCERKRITWPNYTEKYWQDTNILEIKAYLGNVIPFELSNIFYNEIILI